MQPMPPQSASSKLSNMLHLTYQMQTQLKLSIKTIQDLEQELQTQKFDRALDNISIHTDDAAIVRIKRNTAQMYTSPSSSHS